MYNKIKQIFNVKNTGQDNQKLIRSNTMIIHKNQKHINFVEKAMKKYGETSFQTLEDERRNQFNKDYPTQTL